MKNFINELSNYLENKNSKILITNDEWFNLLEDNLQINNKKIISKYRNEMLIERANILQNYAQNTNDAGEMYYIYDNNSNNNSYNLCICDTSKSHEVITKEIINLPDGSSLGSVLRKSGENFTLDQKSTSVVNSQINTMIEEKIKQQDLYLASKRIEGHTYEVSEKYLGRILLYDLNNKVNGGLEEFEEIEFPENLYETAQKGDLFIYKNGEYQKHD